MNYVAKNTGLASRMMWKIAEAASIESIKSREGLETRHLIELGDADAQREILLSISDDVQAVNSIHVLPAGYYDVGNLLGLISYSFIGKSGFEAGLRWSDVERDFSATENS